MPDLMGIPRLGLGVLLGWFECSVLTGVLSVLAFQSSAVLGVLLRLHPALFSSPLPDRHR